MTVRFSLLLLTDCGLVVSGHDLLLTGRVITLNPNFWPDNSWTVKMLTIFRTIKSWMMIYIDFFYPLLSLSQHCVRIVHLVNGIKASQEVVWLQMLYLIGWEQNTVRILWFVWIYACLRLWIKTILGIIEQFESVNQLNKNT